MCGNSRKLVATLYSRRVILVGEKLEEGGQGALIVREGSIHSSAYQACRLCRCRIAALWVRHFAVLPAYAYFAVYCWNVMFEVDLFSDRSVVLVVLSWSFVLERRTDYV